MAKDVAKGQQRAATVSWGGEAETVDDLPQVGYRRDTADAVPLGERSEPWYWVAMPNAWQVLAGRVVPSLRRIMLHRGGGQNNVDSVKMADGKLHADPTLALALAARKGETVLDFHDPRTFCDGRPYLTRVRSTGGYISRFEAVYGGSAEQSTDTDKFSAWLSTLIEAGVIPRPPIHQLRRLERNISGQIHAYRDRGGQKAGYGGRVEKLQVDLKAVKAEIKAYDERMRKAAAPAETDDQLPPPPPAPAT